MWDVRVTAGQLTNLYSLTLRLRKRISKRRSFAAGLRSVGRGRFGPRVGKFETYWDEPSPSLIWPRFQSQSWVAAVFASVVEFLVTK